MFWKSEKSIVPTGIWTMNCQPVALSQYTESTSHKSNPSSVLQGIVDSYSTLPWVTWEAVTVVEGIPWWGLLQHRLANSALVYPSQGGRYRAKGCMALGYRLQCLKRSPLGTRPHPIVCRPSVHVGLRGRWLNIFPIFCGRAPYWGPQQI